jgi:hypothetical protein
MSARRRDGFVDSAGGGRDVAASAATDLALRRAGRETDARDRVAPVAGRGPDPRRQQDHGLGLEAHAGHAWFPRAALAVNRPRLTAMLKRT